MSAYQSIKVSLIDIPEGRLRDVDQDWQNAWPACFRRPARKRRLTLSPTAGGSPCCRCTSLTAAGIAKWKDIDARVLEPQGEQAADELRLHEILENLARKDFTPWNGARRWPK